MMTPTGQRLLFLDDYRNPEDCIQYMGLNIYTLQWEVVRSYDDFTKWITVNGLPSLISFDHDLSEGHYHQNMQQGAINYDSSDFETTSYKTG